MIFSAFWTKKLAIVMYGAPVLPTNLAHIKPGQITPAPAAGLGHPTPASTATTKSPRPALLVASQPTTTLTQMLSPTGPKAPPGLSRTLPSATVLAPKCCWSKSLLNHLARLPAIAGHYSTSTATLWGRTAPIAARAVAPIVIPATLAFLSKCTPPPS